MAATCPVSGHSSSVAACPVTGQRNTSTSAAAECSYAAQNPAWLSPNGTPRRPFVLGSRNSKLALVQAEYVKARLQKRWPGLEVEIKSMLSSGDKDLQHPLYVLGGKSLWTKELEVALLHGSVDAVVHSLKDMPTSLPPGCVLSCVPEREDSSDALVVKAGLPYKCLADMPDGSIIGTSSVRRVAQLRRSYPKLKFADVRGNLQTRFRKLDDPETEYTALVLASAGLIRLGMDERIVCRVGAPELNYAVGQGALGIETRERDRLSEDIVRGIVCWKTEWTTAAERSLLRILEGGCSVPVSCHTGIVDETDNDELVKACPVVGHMGVDFHPMNKPRAATLTLLGAVTSLAGTKHVTVTRSMLVHSTQDAETLGARVARELVEKGGRKIIDELRTHVKEVTEVNEGKEMPFTSNGKGAPSNPSYVHNGDASRAHVLTAYSEEGTKCLRPTGWEVPRGMASTILLKDHR